MTDFSVPNRHAGHASNVPLLLIAILLVGFGVYGLANLDASGLWLDELWSLLYSDPEKSLSLLYNKFWIQDANPPLYHFVLYYWLWALSNGETTIRLLSWLFAVGAATVAYMFARKLYRKPVAFVLAACLYFTPGLTQYSLEARAYTLLIMLTTAFVLQGIILCERAHTEQALDRNGLIMFILLGMLTGLTHYFGLLLYGVLGGYVYVTARRQTDDAGRVLLYGTTSAAIYSIWLAATYHLVQLRIRYRSNRDFEASAEWFGNSLGDALSLGFGEWWVVVAMMLLVILAIVRLRKEYLATHKFLLPLAGTIGVCAISWVVTLYTNVFIPRYFMVLIPMFLIMAVTALDKLVPPKIFPWVGVVICCVLAYEAIDRVTLIKSEMREAGSFILVQPGCQSAHVLVAPDLGAGVHHFRYYLPRDTVQLVTNRDASFGEVAKMVMTQECNVIMWLMDFQRPHEYYIDHFGLDPDRLSAHQFIGTTVFTRNEAP